MRHHRSLCADALINWKMSVGMDTQRENFDLPVLMQSIDSLYPLYSIALKEARVAIVTWSSLLLEALVR